MIWNWQQLCCVALKPETPGLYFVHAKAVMQFPNHILHIISMIGDPHPTRKVLRVSAYLCETHTGLKPAGLSGMVLAGSHG